MPFIANTEQDRKEMLAAVGCADMETLWQKAAVPAPTSDFAEIPTGLSELETAAWMTRLAAKNAVDTIAFLGMGYYDHYIPAAVSEILGRTEFYTAYTPYQPEASQGTLQTIFEWQSSICRLTGMEVSNASMFDGGSALFEAMAMAMRITRRRHIVISGAISPIYRDMIECYSANLDCEITVIAADGVSSAIPALKEAVTDKTACLIVQYPNTFGTVEEWTEVVAAVHAKKALAVCSAYPTALAVLKTPAEMGFDIVTGEAQPLGNALSFGGPYLGYMCTTKKHMRKMPGRIVGRTVDTEGRLAYVLTLQAREQHIRRDAAMSNICSNENLCALAATVYLTLLGKQGLIDVAELSMSKARYTLEKLTAIPGVKRVGDTPFFNEFVIELPMDAAIAAGKLLECGFAAGFPLVTYFKDRTNQLLVSVTEKRTREEIDAFAKAMEAVVCN